MECTILQEATEKSDVYSFAIILFELLTREVPWQSKPKESLPYMVGEMKKRPESPKLLVVEKELLEMKKLMEDCWRQEASER